MDIQKIQVENVKIPELIMNSLISAVNNGTIVVGEELPSERDLADKLGVSRGPLRECMAILEFMGAIESKGYRKTLIRDAEYINRVREWVNTMAEVGTQKTVHEFRRIIEVGAAQLACENATEADLAKIEEAVLALEKNPECYENDVKFHNAVAEATHNVMIVNTEHLVNTFISEIRLKYFDKPRYPEKTLQSHQNVFYAIRDRDVQRAQLEMIYHLNIAAEFFEKYQ